MPDNVYNKTVAEGANYLLGDPEQKRLFSQPIQSDEDFLTRGLLTPEGQPTDRGHLFLELQDAGVLDQHGAITPKGQAYTMTRAEAVDGGEETLPAYIIRKQDGLDDHDVSFSDQAEGVGGHVWSAVKGLGTMIGLGFTDLGRWGLGQERDKKLDAEIRMANTSFLDNVVKANTGLIGMLGVADAQLVKATDQVIDQKALASDELDVWRARQQRDAIFQANEDAATGKMLDAFTPGDIKGQANADYARNTMKQTGAEWWIESPQALERNVSATGSMIDATWLIPGGAAAKGVSETGLISRLELQADKVIAQGLERSTRIAEINAEMAAKKAIAAASERTVEQATQRAESLANQFNLTGNAALDAAAQQAKDIALKHQGILTPATEDLARLGRESTTLAEQSAKLANRIPEAAAQGFAKTVELGRQVRGAPAVVVGRMLESVGSGVEKVDKTLRGLVESFGAETAYGALRAGMAFGGYHLGGIPGLAAATTVLSSGPMLQKIGAFSRIVGKTMMEARSQVPFWQRVANFAELSPVHRGVAHLLDTATLGGYIPGIARNVRDGMLHAAPIDMSFQYLIDDYQDPGESLKGALSRSLVFGGSIAALGGVFAGEAARHRKLAVGDEINFRAGMADDKQKVLYEQLSPDARRAVATYSAVNPELDIRFTDSGSSSYDKGIASININSENPLKPLIAHEVMHHVVVKNQMEDGVIAMMVGDGQRGGLLRDNNGKLETNFQQFWDEYNARMGKPVDIQTAALEYYVDSSADRLAGMAESGELGVLASRTKARRNFGQFIDATLPKIPLIRDLHMKMGGLRDSQGNFVMGNGLLADGIRELPGVKNMTMQMLGRSAGRAPGQFDPLGALGKGDKGGPALAFDAADPHMVALAGVSTFQMEVGPDGRERVKRDANGNPIPIDRATDLARSQTGTLLREILQEKKDNGHTPADGEVHMADDGTVQGYHLGEDTIKMIEQRGSLNREQMRNLRNINRAVREGDGSPFTVVYQPATRKIGKRVRYATLGQTLRTAVPVAMTVTKDGNLIYGLLSVTQLMQNVEKRSMDRRGRRLYNGNKSEMLKDVAEVMNLHKQNQRTDAYFDQKYGPVKAGEYKNFVNTLFGLMTPSMKNVNPLFEADKISYKDNVYKTYRVDRTNQAARMVGDTVIKMPFGYEPAKLNLMPNGLPTLDKSGRPVVRNMPDNETSKMDLSPQSNINFERIKELGVTNDLREAGYITPEGRLVDLSGKKEGGAPRTRNYDHREAGGNDGMMEFMNMGNIRIAPIPGGYGGINIVRMPSSSALNKLRAFIDMHDGNVVVDLQDGLGNYRGKERGYMPPDRVTYLEYDNAKSVKVIGDIRRFFNGEDLSGRRFMPEKEVSMKQEQSPATPAAENQTPTNQTSWQSPKAKEKAKASANAVQVPSGEKSPAATALLSSTRVQK